jgi:hypothetical protein
MPNIESDDHIKIHADLEAEDTLAVRLRHLRVENVARSGPMDKALERQTREIVDRVNYLGGELALIENDAVASAVQIRSKKPEDGKFAEVILKGGNVITVEGRGHALHVSRENYGKLVELLKDLVG